MLHYKICVPSEGNNDGGSVPLILAAAVRSKWGKSVVLLENLRNVAATDKALSKVSYYRLRLLYTWIFACNLFFLGSIIMPVELTLKCSKTSWNKKVMIISMTQIYGNIHSTGRSSSSRSIIWKLFVILYVYTHRRDSRRSRTSQKERASSG